MKKNRILFIYSFLYVSYASFSQLYAAPPLSFLEDLKKDAENCDFLQKALNMVKCRGYKWRGIQCSDSFVAITNPIFKGNEKEEYNMCLKGALQTAQENSELKLKRRGSIHWVYQGERLSYYVGEKKGTFRLFAKVSEAEYTQFPIQKQAKRFLLNIEGIQKLLSQEFQMDEPLGTELKKLKEVLFPDEEIVRGAQFFCRKIGEFAIFFFHRDTEEKSNYINTVNQIFETFQTANKSLGPFVIGKTKTCTYSLQKKNQENTNVTLYITFNTVKNFNRYLRHNDGSDLESLNHSTKPVAVLKNKKKNIEILSNEDVSRKRQEYVAIINRDLTCFEVRHKNSNLPSINVLSEHTALANDLKTIEDKDSVILHKGIKKSSFIEKIITESKNNAFYTNTEGWTYSYLPLHPRQMYIKVPVEVGKIFKETAKKRLERFSQPLCRNVILEDIQGESNDALLLKKIFGMNDKICTLDNIQLYMPGDVLRIQVNNVDLESLFKNTDCLRGSKYTYTLIKKVNTLIKKVNYIQVDGIEDLSALRVRKNETLFKKENSNENSNDKNENSFQNFDDAYAPVGVDSQIVKEEALDDAL